MLRVEVLVDALVEFLVGACGFRGVQVAATRDVAVGRVEVESARHGFKVVNG